MPLSLVLAFIPLLFGKPTISEITDYLEQRIPDLKGRLYVVMAPFPSALDAEKFKRKALNECISILGEKNPEKFFKFRIGPMYILPFPILILFILLSGPILNRVNPLPVLSYIETPTEKNSQTLIIAECPSLTKLYLFGEKKPMRMLRLGDNRFAIMLKPDHSMELETGYRIWRSGKESLTVMPRIKVKKLTLEYQFPLYLKIKPLCDTILEVADKIPIGVLSGTTINFYGNTNVPLGKIAGDLSEGKVAANYFEGSFKVLCNDNIEVELMDTLLFSSYSLYFILLPIMDEPPSIEFLSPIGDYKLDERMEVNIRLQARDDYGLRSLELLYGKESIDLGEVNAARFAMDSLCLQLSGLLPGETLKVRASAYDLAGNRTLTPPLNIFMPSLEEMFSNYREQSDTLSSVASDLQKREEELTKRIEEYLSKSELTPESKYGIKETLRDQKDLLEDIERMAELAKKMQNPLVMEELERINKLLDELRIEEVMKQLENMEENQDYAEEKLRELNLTQEKILQALKLGRKSLESLKELAELNEFIRRTEDIYTEQNRIAGSSPNDSIASLEKELSEKLKRMIEEMKESSYKELGEIAKDFEGSRTEQNMAELASEMMKCRMSKARAEEIKKSLEKLLKALQSEHGRRTGESIVKALREKAWELGSILNMHNALMGDGRGVEQGLLEQGLSEGVTQIRRELETLFLMSFAFSPEVLKNLSEASSNMQELGEELITHRPQKSSMERVNNLLIESIIQLFSSPPGSGQAMLSAMTQIISQQRSISNQIQQLLPIPGNKGRGALAKLGQKQRKLASELREMGEALSPIAKEMEDMADKMERGELDMKVMERQQRVLDRLLEVSKSIRRKEVSKKRRSRPGVFVSPGKITLPQDLGEEKKALRELLKQRIKEPYPRAYEKEIETYIRKLLE